ncbi:MAG: methionine biosynthesis protein MetW [Alphaproteobacteria bacterium]|nr:methionine biosynthesis protein MetW [Alphaproteobacteria bacterium]
MNAPTPALPDLRPDLARIAVMVAPGTRVLDVGCGDGALLAFLKATKDVDARGLELSQEGVNACVSRGLSVIQGDADSDLADYPSGIFDYVILSQTIQATRKPSRVLKEILRIGRRAIVSFPNFGFWKVRLQLLLSGRMPVTGQLTQSWHETNNIHLCTLADFVDLALSLELKIEEAVAIHDSGRMHGFKAPDALENLFATNAILLLSR